jgi:PadR family transcriptional regulator PadR
MGPDGKTDLLQGTLDLLVLKALTRGASHGYGLARWIQETSDDALRVEEGSLYPALYRLERRGLVASTWGLSENNRRARYYKLTPNGRRQLEAETTSWGRLATAIGKILQAT